MKPFTLLATQHPAAPDFAALDLGHCDWKAQTWRQDHPASAHKDTETIYYRMPEVINERTVFDDVSVVDLPTYTQGVREIVNYVHSLVKDFDSECGEVGRVMLVKLKAGGTILEHIDEGSYADAHYRSHIVVRNDPDVIYFAVGGVAEHTRMGSVWLIDHKQRHTVTNWGKQDRIHLIVDVRRSKHAVDN